MNYSSLKTFVFQVKIAHRVNMCRAKALRKKHLLTKSHLNCKNLRSSTAHSKASLQRWHLHKVHKLFRDVTVNHGAKTKALRKNFFKQKMIYVHYKTLPLQDLQILILVEIAPTLPSQTVNDLKLQVNQTYISQSQNKSKCCYFLLLVQCTMLGRALLQFADHQANRINDRPCYDNDLIWHGALLILFAKCTTN